ncbi:tautomerase family protein [Methylomonas paludis]|uniref:L-dopachrome isomerase n=1 Tax=Methylomonas paludis TaxID=1173101 RepID=A0A975MNZ2_9GAMM|nr:phenylpyruvate tautomerase MIF-related protein [Methylomonas paludis]QWF70856.1 tautomerase family protein [Methylomonas paludis]
MPFLNVNTNIKISAAEKPQLLKEVSTLIAQHTGKPESYVMVHLHDEQTMLFAGSQDPLAYLECKSIGLSKNQVQALTKTLSHYLSTSLKLNPARIYIEFSNAPAELWAWNGATFG